MSQPVDLERVKDILEQVLEQPESERPASMHRLCAGDSALLREVKSLLEQDTGPTPSLTQPFFELLTAPDPEHGLDLGTGRRIGPYQVQRKLDEGGMGIVVLATRADDFEKQVAIKVIKPGLVNNEVLQRFHNERQILAHLDHPSIARILDGGTTEEGLPYFVMEYVEGTRIDQYCRENRLSLRQRLEIFRQLCSALQVAHRNLVVHRDLKPSNILVTPDGVPKLLDFGIAKRLTPDADNQITRLAQSPMTLKYASPEQIHPTRPISIASDIYSVGVLLFEALTDQYPYDAPDSDNHFDLARAICDDQPRLPSQMIRADDATLNDVESQETSRFEQQRLRHLLSGDLDSIVLKALAKNPDDRYGTIGQLADDLGRFLEGHPVSAREGTFLYRANKFARRNLLPLATALIVLVSLVAAGALWLEQRETEQKAVYAEKQAKDADERAKSLQVFFNHLFLDLSPDQSINKKLTIVDFLATGVEKAQEIQDPDAKSELLVIFGGLYKDFDLLEEAELVLEEAYQILLNHSERDNDLMVARAYGNLAVVYHNQARFQKALEINETVLDMRQAAGQEGHELAPTMSSLASTHAALGNLDLAESLYRDVYQIRLEHHGPGDLHVAVTQRDLANHYLQVGRLDEAESLIKKALYIFENQDERNRNEAAAVSTLGRIQRERGKLNEAISTFEKNLAFRRNLFPNHETHNHIVMTKVDLASALVESDPDRATILLEEAIEALRSEGNEDSWMMAEARSWQGHYLTSVGRLEEAERVLLESFETLKQLRGINNLYSRNCLKHLVSLYKLMGKEEEAEHYQKILENTLQHQQLVQNVVN